MSSEDGTVLAQTVCKTCRAPDHGLAELHLIGTYHAFEPIFDTMWEENALCPWCGKILTDEPPQEDGLDKLLYCQWCQMKVRLHCVAVYHYTTERVEK